MEKGRIMAERLDKINPKTGKKYCYGNPDCFYTGNCSTCSEIDKRNCDWEFLKECRTSEGKRAIDVRT